MIEFGTTFSAFFAAELGLEWQNAYQHILHELGLRHVRIPIYWQEVEPQPGQFCWDAIDWQLQEAAAAKVKVTLTVGQRAPRYPECFSPPWTHDLEDGQFKAALFTLIQHSVERFKGHPSLETWQVENEPLAAHYWGLNCRNLTHLVGDEIELVRSLDPEHAIVVTYFSSVPWMMSQLRGTLKFGADIVAATVFDKLYYKSALWNGYIALLNLGPFSPMPLSQQRSIAAAQRQKFWVMELQAEPWGPDAIIAMSPQQRYESINPERLRQLVARVVHSGTSRLYFWGTEWWLAEKQIHHNSSMWDTGKALIRKYGST